MTQKEFNEKAKRYIELSAKIKEMQNEADKIKDDIQQTMKNGQRKSKEYVATLSTWDSARFDSTTFKEDHPQMYTKYIKSVSNHRFNCKAV